MAEKKTYDYKAATAEKGLGIIEIVVIAAVVIAVVGGTLIQLVQALL